MKKFWQSCSIGCVAAALLTAVLEARPTPLGTAFTYQGQLKQSGSLISGTVDFEFRLFDVPAGGSPINGVTLSQTLTATNGLFTAELDFGAGMFAGNERWLDIAVRFPSGSGNYAPLVPRQRLSAAPYALYSLGTGVIANGSLIGTYTNPLTLSNAANSFTGSGAGLMSLNASNLTTGAVGGALLQGTYSSVVTFSSNLNSFAGSGALLDNLDAGRITTGALNVSRMPFGGTWNLFSDLNIDGALFVNGGANLIGIGTLSPSVNLHIVDPTFSRMRLERTGGAVVTAKALVANGSIGTDNAMPFSVTTNNTDRVYITATGDVGIGTTSPLQKLHVSGNVQVDGTATMNSDVIGGRLLGGSGTASLPSVAFSTDGTSGLYRPTGSTLGVSTGGVERMRVDSAGNVGIGTISPLQKLDVSGNIRFANGQLLAHAGTVSQPSLSFNSDTDTGFHSLAADQIGVAVGGTQLMTIGPAVSGVMIDGFLTVKRSGLAAGAGSLANFNRLDTDGPIVLFSQDSVSEGNISVSGTTISYNAFTGSHYGWTDQPIERFALVRLTGENRRLHNNPDSEIVYGIEPASRANDPACLGAYLSLLAPGAPASNENPHLVMAVGNGEMLVVDSGQGDIQPGDYLIASDTSGCAMKDDPQQFPIGHIVARAAEAVVWSEIAFDSSTIRRKKISVLFGNFVRSNQADQLAQRVSQLEQELTSLRDVSLRLARLEQLTQQRDSTAMPLKEKTQ